MKCEVCLVPAGTTCAYESRRRMCKQGAYFGVHATGGEDLLDAVYPNRFGPSPGIDTWLARRMLIFACDYRGPQSACGCTSTVVCFMGVAGRGRQNASGTWDATFPECLACVSSNNGDFKAPS